MAIKQKQLQKTILVCGLLLALNANAQSSGSGQINFPDISYTSQQMKDANCDPTVYQQLYNRQKMEYEGRQPAMQDVLVKKQLEAQPKEATNAALRCIDGAVNQLKGIGNTVDSILGMITGDGTNWSALGSTLVNQLGNMACNQINNYTNGAMYSATSPFTSTINQGVGAINSTGVSTPVGNLNVGGQVWNAAQKGTPTGTGPISGAINTGVGAVNGAANNATGILK